MTNPPRLPLAVILLTIGVGAQADGVRTAPMLANTCAGYHGTNGASAGEFMPSIAGMDPGYLYWSVPRVAPRGARADSSQGWLSSTSP